MLFENPKTPQIGAITCLLIDLIFPDGSDEKRPTVTYCFIGKLKRGNLTGRFFRAVYAKSVLHGGVNEHSSDFTTGEFLHSTGLFNSP